MTRDQMVATASRIQNTMSTPGWQDIIFMLREKKADYKESLFKIMATKPDTLTGKTAIRYAASARALEEFEQVLDDAIQILVPNPSGGASEVRDGDA